MVKMSKTRLLTGPEEHYLVICGCWEEMKYIMNLFGINTNNMSIHSFRVVFTYFLFLHENLHCGNSLLS